MKSSVPKPYAWQIPSPDLLYGFLYHRKIDLFFAIGYLFLQKGTWDMNS